MIRWAQHHLQWILQCQQNISISKIIRIICQITRQDHGYTHSLCPAAGDMIGPVIQGYFAGTTDMDTTLDQLDSKFSELLE